MHKEESKAKGRDRRYTTAKRQPEQISENKTYCAWAKGVDPSATSSM